ncbi:MAG TPA: hypothetical protein VL285_26595, partial [Bryobacteraceae bacterium]|nr:hypothetical protein [Bryobacteraceae bacterium]
MDANGGDARTGSITAAGQTFAVTQSSLTCSFTLNTGRRQPPRPLRAGYLQRLRPVTGDNRYLTTTLGDMRVLFDGASAPRVFSGNGQCGAIVP